MNTPLGGPSSSSFPRGLSRWAALLFALAGAASLHADLMSIDNYSFESANYTGANSWTNDLNSNPPGTINWTGRDGSTSGQCFIERIGGFISHGLAHIGMENNYFVYWDTGLPWEANTKYTLTVGVGNRNATFTTGGNLSVIGLTDTVPAGANMAELLANDPFLAGANTSKNCSTQPGSSFQDIAVVLDTGPAAPAGTVIVVLGDTSSPASRSHFDNVRLDATSLLDPDGDGLPSPWETANGLNPNSSAGNDGAAGDPDADASPNSQEFTRGTNPQDNDSDNDAALDGAETLTGTFVSPSNTGTDPLDSDSDGDTLLDGNEITAATPTDPNKPDTDGDAFEDQAEIASGTNPSVGGSFPASTGDLAVSLNFVGGRVDGTLGAAVDVVAGVVPLSNWNNLIDLGGSGVALVNSQGAPVIQRASWTVDDTFTVSTETPADGNAKVMLGYLKTRNGVLTEVIVRNIPVPSYDVYVYCDSEGVDGVSTYTCNGATISGVMDNDNWPIGAGGGTFVVVSTNDAAGNVVVFRNVTGPTLTITAANTGPDFRAPINAVQIIRATGDTDLDGMPDLWEDANGLNKNVNDAAGDPDSDSSTNLQEFQRNTNPQDNDTDNDGLLDGVETDTGTFVSPTNTGTDPSLIDTDGDGLGDGIENNSGTFVDPGNPGTNPTKADTDADGSPDGSEVAVGTNPHDPASIASVIAGAGKWTTEHVWTRSNPQIPDLAAAEAALDTPPADSITVQTSYVHFHDNAPPPWFVSQSTPYPLFTSFGDREDFAIRCRGKIKITKPGMVWFDGNTDDGFSLRVDGTEIGAAGNRGRADTVVSADLTAGLHDVEFVQWERGGGAGVSLLVYRGITDQPPAVDGVAWQLLEIFLDVTDADGDGMLDSYETANGLNPAVNDAAADKDGDTLTNLTEFQRGTRADMVDTDADGLNDNVETDTGTFVNASNTGTDPLKADTDGDKLRDGAETNTGTFVSASNAGTNPHNRDTDADTFSDGEEIIAGTNPVSAASKPPLPIPTGFWPFDDQDPIATEDISLGGHDGTIVGGATYVAGHTGTAGDSAIQFNGADAGVTSGASLLNGLSAFTMCGWVNFTEPQNARTALFGQNDVVEFGMINATTLELWNPTGGAVQFTFGPSNGWQHVAVVADGTGRRIYIDGVLSMSGGVGTPTATSVDRFNMGFAVADATGNFYNGVLDDVAVWNTALPADIIARLASGELTPLPLAPPLPRFAITNVQFNTTTRELTLTFDSVAGKTYGIDTRDATAGWAEIGQVTASGPSTSFTQVIPVGVTVRLYKVNQLGP